MKRAPALAAAFLLLAPLARSADPAPADAPKKPFKASFIGENGGYKGSDPVTDQYLQGGLGAAPANPLDATPAATPAARPDATPARAPIAAPAAANAASSDSSLAPVSPRTDAPSRSSAARPAATERNISDREATRPAARPSLWNGLVKPLDMPSAQTQDSDPESARAGSDGDYDSHILGAAPGTARPALKDSVASPSAPAGTTALAGAAPANGGRVFVSLELDPREAGSLRDAVAGLSAASGFAADARFEAMPGPGGTAKISGWINSSRLADALSRPGVKRLSIEPVARPSTARPVGSPFFVGLRVADPARASEAVDAGVRSLGDAAGFRLTRVVGLETAPDGRAVAVLEGTLPLSRLSKALDLPEVAKILPVGFEPPTPPAPASSTPAPGARGFASFALQRGWWLIVLTLLLALPSLRAPARRAAAVFSPYR